VSAPTPTGWADERLMHACDYINAVLLETDPNHDAHRILTRALGLVEDADFELEGTRA